VISLEMSKKQLYLRSLFQKANVPSDLLNYGTMSADQLNDLTRAASELNKVPIYIDDATEGTASQIIAKAEHLCNTKDIDMLVFDYLQLADEPGAASRNLELGKITGMMKRTAKKLDVPFVVLSQLTKDADGRMPVLKDLRDSGSIEQDADIVIFVWRPEQCGIDVDKEGSTEGVAMIEIAKNRNGKTSDFRLRWVPELMKFTQNYRGEDAPDPEPEQAEVF